MKSKNRCCVCDYSGHEGSEYANIEASDEVRVVWDSELQDYYCTACLISIRSTIRDYNYYEDEEQDN